MGLLSSITNLNPLSIVSNVVESACDKLLPKNLEFIGDLAGLAADYASGNVAKCAEDVQDLIQDLPQQLAQLASNQGQNSAAGTSHFAPWGVQPDPPTPFSSRLAPSFMTAVLSLKRDPNSTGTTNAPSPASSTSAGGSTQTTGSAEASQSAGATSAGEPAEVAESTAPARTVKLTNAAKSTDAAAAAKSTASAADTKSTQSAKSSDTTSADAFFKLSDKDLMNTLRDGKLPESVSKDPAQMQRLQLRMNDISQMNQLITTMIAALHDMNKQVIQNLHV